MWRRGGRGIKNKPSCRRAFSTNGDNVDEASPKKSKPIARRLVIRFHPMIVHVVEAFVRCSNPRAEMVMDQSLPDGKMILEFHNVDGTVIVWGSTEDFIY